MGLHEGLRCTRGVPRGSDAVDRKLERRSPED